MRNFKDRLIKLIEAIKSYDNMVNIVRMYNERPSDVMNLLIKKEEYKNFFASALQGINYENTKQRAIELGRADIISVINNSKTEVLTCLCGLKEEYENTPSSFNDIEEKIDSSVDVSVILNRLNNAKQNALKADYYNSKIIKVLEPIITEEVGSSFTSENYLSSLSRYTPTLPTQELYDAMCDEYKTEYSNIKKFTKRIIDKVIDTPVIIPEYNIVEFEDKFDIVKQLPLNTDNEDTDMLTLSITAASALETTRESILVNVKAFVKSLKNIEEIDNNIDDVLDIIHNAVIKQINSEITNDELGQVLSMYGSLISYNLYNIATLTNYMSDYSYRINNAYQTIMYVYEKLNYVTLTSYIKE